MSRTDNTRPSRLQEQDDHRHTHDVEDSHGGVGKDATLQEHQARQRVRQSLARGDEPEPTRHRHDARDARDTRDGSH
jgi:hypothetical protein